MYVFSQLLYHFSKCCRWANLGLWSYVFCCDLFFSYLSRIFLVCVSSAQRPRHNSLNRTDARMHAGRYVWSSTSQLVKIMYWYNLIIKLHSLMIAFVLESIQPVQPLDRVQITYFLKDQRPHITQPIAFYFYPESPFFEIIINKKPNQSEEQIFI